MVLIDEPSFLTVGTEVSAKYKGAFCEAKIRKISKIVKCKVQYSNGTSAFVPDELIIGTLKVGASVKVKCGEKKEVEAIIQKIQDCSQYTVVFDDGDITCLKRTALCLKSGRHFAASATLDQLPLTHPEHIGTPVHTNIVHGRRIRKHLNSVSESGEEEATVMEENDIGKVVCVEANDKKKVRDNWFPGLVVAPTAHSSVKTNTSEDYLVRSFKDGKYYTVPKKEITDFTKEIGARVESPTLKTAVEKAILFLDKDELPPHWDRDLLFGVDKNCITTDSEGVYDSDNSEEEISIEEKDHFVAQLYKFMDDRATPLNDAPVINGRDVDLHKLFKVVTSFGGFNKVCKFKQWKLVAQKIGFEDDVSSLVRFQYQHYLHSFEDFNRKLGCTMLSHPRGVRSRSRFSRSIIRDIDKAIPGTSSLAEKNKQVASVKPESNIKLETVKGNDSFKDPVVVKKTAKAIKAEEKLSNKNIDESSKKGDKKKDENINNTLRNRQSVKWGPDTLETKDSSKNKKELKEPLKKEIKKEEIDGKQSDNDSIENIKEKKKFSRNLFGKSIKKSTKKEKIVKVKLTETGLTAARKMRSFKDHLKSFSKIILPFKNSKRGSSNTQQETVSKIKPEEDIPKLTRSKSKEDLPPKRKMSILSDPADIVSIVQPASSGLIVENVIKIKKSDEGSEKKKTVRKKKDDKDEKVPSTDLISSPVATEIETSEKDTPVAVGDNLVVYYGDKHATTYDAKVLNVCDFDGEKKYYVHYKGWNSRYDEWIDITRIALKSKGPEPEPEVENDADSSKSEQKNIDSKKLPTTNSRTRRSVTPSTSNVNTKKSPFTSARPTRTCTLSERPLSTIDNSDSESEYSGNLGLAKQYNKKSQQALKAIKSEQDITLKPDSLDTVNQKKSLFPKTYPSKEVLMQRNVPRKPKSCVFKVSNKSEEQVCEQVTLKPPLDFSFEMPPPCNSKQLNLDNDNIPTESEKSDSIQNEPKISPIHYLSPKEKSEKNDQQQTVSDLTKSSNEKKEICLESLTQLPLKSKNVGLVFYQSSSEDEEQIQLKGVSKVKEELSSVKSLPLDVKTDESKISGTDFDLNKIRSEMKGLMPTSNSNSIDLVHSNESYLLDQLDEIDVSKSIDSVTEDEDVYEFKESEPCNFESISSVEEKQRKVKPSDSPKLYSFEKSLEQPKSIESLTQTEVDDKNESMAPFESNSNSACLFDDNVEINTKKDVFKENLIVKNTVGDSISHVQSDEGSNESVNLVVKDTLIDPICTNESDDNSQDETCHIKDHEPDMKDEVLNLCMKPPESPPNNIFSMPEPNESNDIVEDVDDDEDDDESKLVIAENDKIETDYQIDTDLAVAEEHNFSNEHTKNIQTQSPPPLPPSIHQLPITDTELKSAYEVKVGASNDTDDESTTSCNESEQNTLFQMYSRYGKQSNKTNDYQSFLDDDDDSTKSGFEFESSSKSPTFECSENIESVVKLSTNESHDKPKVYDYVNAESEKQRNTVLPELQCREEILDEETLNNALVIEYNKKNVDFDIHKPSTSRGFFDAINQPPNSSKDNFYKTDTSRDTKNNLFESKQSSLVKSVIFDTNAPSSSMGGMFEDNHLKGNSKDSFYDSDVPSISKSSFYENSMPSTSRRFCNPEVDVPDVLHCEETIPGSPTGVSEEQNDQEEKKRRAMAQDLYDRRQAASTMYSMKSYRRVMIDRAQEVMDSYPDVHQNDGALDQRHLQFLAEVSSSRNLGLNVNEPLVVKLPELEPEKAVEQVEKSPEKLQTKRKTSSSSSQELTPKRHKTPTPVPATEGNNEKPAEIKMNIPLKDGKPLVSFTPEMDSVQRQATILARINDLRKEYITIKSRVAIIDRRRKKIRKRKRELAKSAMNQSKQILVASISK